MHRLSFRTLPALLAAALLCASVHAERGDVHFAVRVPISLCWWTPTDDDWHGKVSGLGGIRAGIDLFPLTQGKYLDERGFRPSLRLLAGYRLGMGDPATYSARLHTLLADCSLLFRYNVTGQHHGYIGLGAQWQADMLDYEPKYRGRTLEAWRGTALSVCAGYELALGGRLWAFGELGFTHPVGGGLLDAFMPVLGLSWGIEP